MPKGRAPSALVRPWALVICWSLGFGHWVLTTVAIPPQTPNNTGKEEAAPGAESCAPAPLMDERIAKLAEKAKGLPRAPGVYLMKDDKGRVIYVGKSASLRERVASYFQPATKLGHKKVGLIDHIIEFEVIETDSEVEALLAENRLIKDIQPRYNARLLDDKTFPYLMVTTGDEYPGVYVTREPRTDGVKLYGPFTSVWQLKDAV